MSLAYDCATWLIPRQQPRFLAWAPWDVDEVDVVGRGRRAEDAVVVLCLPPGFGAGGCVGEKVDPVGGDAFVVAPRPDGVTGELDPAGVAGDGGQQVPQGGGVAVPGVQRARRV